MSRLLCRQSTGSSHKECRTVQVTLSQAISRGWTERPSMLVIGGDVRALAMLQSRLRQRRIGEMTEPCKRRLSHHNDTIASRTVEARQRSAARSQQHGHIDGRGRYRRRDALMPKGSKAKDRPLRTRR